MKRSETVGNMIRPKLVQPAFFLLSISAQRNLFFEGPKVSKGKRLETVGDRAFARQKSSCFVAYVHEKCLKLCKSMSFLPSEGAISDCFQPFPLGHLWTFKKTNALRGNA